MHDRRHTFSCRASLRNHEHRPASAHRYRPRAATRRTHLGSPAPGRRCRSRAHQSRAPARELPTYGPLCLPQQGWHGRRLPRRSYLHLVHRRCANNPAANGDLPARRSAKSRGLGVLSPTSGTGSPPRTQPSPLYGRGALRSSLLRLALPDRRSGLAQPRPRNPARDRTPANPGPPRSRYATERQKRCGDPRPRLLVDEPTYSPPLASSPSPRGPLLRAPKPRV